MVFSGLYGIELNRNVTQDSCLNLGLIKYLCIVHACLSLHVYVI